MGRKNIVSSVVWGFISLNLKFFKIEVFFIGKAWFVVKATF